MIAPRFDVSSRPTPPAHAIVDVHLTRHTSDADIGRLFAERVRGRWSDDFCDHILTTDRLVVDATDNLFFVNIDSIILPNIVTDDAVIGECDQRHPGRCTAICRGRTIQFLATFNRHATAALWSGYPEKILVVYDIEEKLGGNDDWKKR